ncbi:hypothetical protein DPMN_086633 [Dreissena polymorpha]|uniref:protein-histidine N-methyltransferase n=2 Tax=Dreissena polymorpha TaxID=45954 RepID=A0A9D4KRD2_DREPO|nr:hypothetical protein DPMN_086633 [Dreissena polymorpha]
MMTSDSAQKSVLGPLINADKILQVMPSVVLALHLLCERRSEQSPWKPYLDILPDTYNTPLYFTPDDVKLLKGSPAQSDCMNQFRNIARQYGYFYKLFQSDPAIAASLPIKDVFTYDDYRWAVSTVMTRQNQIPTPDGNKMTFALIPLWDMCNHCSGIITTSFNLEQNCSECYALRDYTQGDQIFIFYGARSNAELLVNNGFVYMENEHDRTAVRLGIGKADPLLDLKSKLLARCGLEPSRTFYLHTGEYSVDSNLLIFLRVFQMDEDTLKSKCSRENVEEVKAELGDLNKVVSIETESKVWSFLETRTGLLLRGYETSLEDDEVLLKSDRLSGCQRLCVQLRCLEKRIFKSSLEFASRQKQKLAPSSGT